MALSPDNDLEVGDNGNGYLRRRTPPDSCPSDSDSCPSDTDSCPSDSTEEEGGELPEMLKFEAKKPAARRKSSIARMISLVMDQADEVSA